MYEILLILLGYLYGSIPFALVIGKVFYNTDVRESGSGNLGGTNAGRVLGKKAGISVIENSFRLAGQLPQDAVLVSESGISDPEVVKRLRTAGFRGFLIGETFMKTPQPGETLQNFLKAIQ